MRLKQEGTIWRKVVPGSESARRALPTLDQGPISTRPLTRHFGAFQGTSRVKWPGHGIGSYHQSDDELKCALDSFPDFVRPSGAEAITVALSTPLLSSIFRVRRIARTRPAQGPRSTASPIISHYT